MTDIPKLYFRKVHKETGMVFVDYFRDQNCPGWSSTPISETTRIASVRIGRWNDVLNPSWLYSIVGWELT